MFAVRRSGWINVAGGGVSVSAFIGGNADVWPVCVLTKAAVKGPVGRCDWSTCCLCFYVGWDFSRILIIAV